MRPLFRPDTKHNPAAQRAARTGRFIALAAGFLLAAATPAIAATTDGAALKKTQNGRSYANDKRVQHRAPAAKPAAPTRAVGGDVLQLGLFASRGDAEWAWLSLNRKNPVLADKLSALIAPAPNGSGHVLRAVVKNPNASGAALCREALSTGQTCFVASGNQQAAKFDAPPAQGAIPIPQVKPPYAGAPAPIVAATTAAAATAVPVASVSIASGAAQTVVPPTQTAVAPSAVTVVTVATPPLPTPPAVAPPQATPPQPGAMDGGMLAARTLDGFIRYSTDDAKVLAEIERRTRRRGRIGAVLPGGGLEVTPAILTQPEFNICALTFDDGPHRTVTRRILEILNEQKVVATYFPVGNVAIRYPDVIRDFVASGHEIGNHSYTHGDMRQMKIETLRHEVAETNRILRELGGSSTLFRPPYGRYSQDLLQVVREEGSQAVLWNVDTRDWKVRDPDKIVEHVTTAAGSGSVLLLHSTYPTTADALPRVISSLREKNCEFVTLSDWIARMQAAGELPVTNAALPGPTPTARLRN